MVPLRTPLAATGFTPHSLELLRDRCGGSGLVPMQGGGGVGQGRRRGEGRRRWSRAGRWPCRLITGDFDLSGIGTVTHIEGNRVYGWGHPFMGLGACDFPLMTGYIHTIYPRQTVSFKMGSPLQTVGVINADVSTCIAGWLGPQAGHAAGAHDAWRSATATRRGPSTSRSSGSGRCWPTLVFTALTNSVDMEGDLPEELTAELEARIELEGRDAGGHQGHLLRLQRRPGAGGAVQPGGRRRQPADLQPLRAGAHQRGSSATRASSPAGARPRSRRSSWTPRLTRRATTVKATVFVRPYKGMPQRLPVTLKLPADLPEGDYTATAVCDDLTQRPADAARQPEPEQPAGRGAGACRRCGCRRRPSGRNLVLRVPLGPSGVALDGKSLPNLPPSMVQILGNSRRTGAQTMSAALVSRQPTDWVHARVGDGALHAWSEHKKATDE